METSYLDYAMSVIVSRALPDVRDGLKPVQRRILYAMHGMNLASNRPFKKCAGIVGEVMGKYHPHGDSPVYEALVRMAQDFTMRQMLVDGQGNFGSVDDDPPAAMRYTEARLAPIAQQMLTDIDLDTVDFVDNYDGSLQEPLVLPARLPNLLVNGVSGIAVGMATNIPPHNLGEVCDAVIYLIDNPDATVDDLIEIVPGPDFPTGAKAYVGFERENILTAYRSGRGRVILQGTVDIEEVRGGRHQLIVTELPYQVNKASLVQRIAQLAHDKKVQGISDVRDESDREGLRVVVDLRRGVPPELVRDALFKHTPLQSTFFMNMLALVSGQPEVLGLRRQLRLYVQHRQDVITRRAQYLLRRAQERAHIVEGLRKAISMLDLVIEIIRNAPDVAAARTGLIEQLDLTEVQAQAILDMQLRRLAALERQRLEDEYEELRKTIAGLEALLGDPAKVLAEVRKETLELKKTYATPRRTEILDGEPHQRTRKELTPHQDVVITLSARGYIKRIPYATYKLQHRGGKGVRGMTTREDDATHQILVVDTHDVLLFFTSAGRMYSLDCFEISSDSSRTSRGTPLVNLVPIPERERITAVLPLPSLKLEDHLIMVTKRGVIKALSLSQIANIRRNGLNAMILKKGDELVSVGLASTAEDVIIVTRKGQAIRFPVSSVPMRTRNAGGVRGIRLDPGDQVVAAGLAVPEDKVLVVTTKGRGKLTLVERFRRQSRGGKGVKSFRISDTTGFIADGKIVAAEGNTELVLISAKSQVTRIHLDEVSLQGRIARGAIIWKPLTENDHLVAVAYYTNKDNGVSKPKNGGSASRKRRNGRNGGNGNSSSE
jgi:DNA gyrase subunit A